MGSVGASTTNIILKQIQAMVNPQDIQAGYTDYEINNLFPVVSIPNKNVRSNPIQATEFVDIDKLKTIQPELSFNVLKEYLTDSQSSVSSSDLPVVTKYKGYYVLLDGNHRAAIEKLRGYSKLKVHIV